MTKCFTLVHRSTPLLLVSLVTGSIGGEHSTQDPIAITVTKVENFFTFLYCVASPCVASLPEASLHLASLRMASLHMASLRVQKLEIAHEQISPVLCLDDCKRLQHKFRRKYMGVLSQYVTFVVKQ